MPSSGNPPLTAHLHELALVPFRAIFSGSGRPHAIEYSPYICMRRWILVSEG